MPELQNLTTQKIDAQTLRIIDEISSQIDSVKQRQVERGMLNSSSTIAQITDVCNKGLNDLGKIIETEYRWMIDQELFATQSSVESLIKKIPLELGPLQKTCISHIQRQSVLIRSPDHIAPNYIEKFEKTVNSVSENIVLSLRSFSAEKRRGIIRS